MLIQNKMTIDVNGNIFHGPAIHSIAFKEDVDENIQLAVLGILNSKLFWFFISNTSTALKGNAYRLTPKYLNNFNFPNLAIDENRVNKVKCSVEKMLMLTHELKKCKTPQQKKLLNQQLKVTNDKINKLVYELYDLTKEEIAIVEKSLK